MDPYQRLVTGMWFVALVYLAVALIYHRIFGDE
jgi:hypothetical protein